MQGVGQREVIDKAGVVGVVLLGRDTVSHGRHGVGAVPAGLGLMDTPPGLSSGAI